MNVTVLNLVKMWIITIMRVAVMMEGTQNILLVRRLEALGENPKMGAWIIVIIWGSIIVEGIIQLVAIVDLISVGMDKLAMVFE
ncbi:MAG: hypothetical protein HY392_00020 [Candidatus Diapherotrites archaeon]|nr:hypothetical protein [Candidatus Diapherotrites archaeon]